MGHLNSHYLPLIRSEVLSKGVDRLLEQVLKEKSASFYSEIESLVHDYLSSIGHYSRIEREKQQKSENENTRLHGNTSTNTGTEGEKCVSKFSDKEIDDFIKEETNRFLEATAEEKMKEKTAKFTNILVKPISEPLLGRKEGEKDVSFINAQVTETIEEPVSNVAEFMPTPADITPNYGDISDKVDAKLEVPSENPKESEQSCHNESATSNKKLILQDGKKQEITEEPDHEILAENASSKQVPSPQPQPMSTDEDNPENEQLGIYVPIISKTDFSAELNPAKINPETSSLNIALSDSDITVSSVHTSDLSSLEDSDLEFEDFKKMTKKTTSTSEKTEGFCSDSSEASGMNSKRNSVVPSDADDEAVIDDSDFGNKKLGKQRKSCQISSSLESECSLEVSLTLTEEQKDVAPQRRSARVASKDGKKVENRDEEPQVIAKKSDHAEKNHESKRRVWQKHREILEEKKRQLADSKDGTDDSAKRKIQKREQRITSDSNESEEIKQSKRSRRTIRPTRCYSPSDNN